MTNFALQSWNNICPARCLYDVLGARLPDIELHCRTQYPKGDERSLCSCAIQHVGLEVQVCRVGNPCRPLLYPTNEVTWRVSQVLGQQMDLTSVAWVAEHKV